MKILDLCSGLGGWSAVWRRNGHRVLCVDIVPPADLIADVRSLGLRRRGWDVIFASPPCTEFSREHMPWHRTGKAPDMSIVDACFAFARQAMPPVFILENVIGAQKHLGKCVQKIGSRLLWGWFPRITGVSRYKCYGKWHISPGPERARIRSLIPPALAVAVYRTITGKKEGI